MPYYVTSDNTKLYYEEKGDGKPILFIHGWSCSTASFEPVVSILKKSYHCISYDHRGHGASSFTQGGYTVDQLARDLNELILFLGIEKVNLVGHSMGASTIYSYVDQFGCEKINKIVLLDMSPKLLNDETWHKGLLRGQYFIDDLMSDLSLMSQDMSLFMWRFWRLVNPKFAALPETMKASVAPGLIGENHPHTLICLWHSILYSDYREALKKISVPTLYGLPDYPLYDEATAEYIQTNIDAPVEIILFEKSTHMIQEEHPQKTAYIMDQFIKA